RHSVSIGRRPARFYLGLDETRQTCSERFARRKSNAPSDPLVEKAAAVRLSRARRDGRTRRRDEIGQTGVVVARRIWGTGPRARTSVLLRGARAAGVAHLPGQS